MFARMSHGGTKHATDNKGRLTPRPSRWANRRVAVLALASVGVVCMTTAPACQTVGPLAISMGIEACLTLVKRLLDAPWSSLPDGYRPCGAVDWSVEGRTLKACTFCNPLFPDRVYVQFDCTGPYYPMDIERIRDRASTSRDEDERVDTGERFITKIECHELFFLKVAGEVADDLQWFGCEFESPNDRVLPDWSGYATLALTIDGSAEAPSDRSIAAGTRVRIEGARDEVAHYAMTAGVTEFGFRDGTDHWRVYLNSDLSAAMVFRNGIHDETRILFAPMPLP